MKLFIDTGNVKEIQALADIGIIDGVTTNPSLMAKETGDYRKTMKEICRIVQGPVSAEVLSTDWEGMLREGATSPRSMSTSSSRCRSRETACERAIR